jgi:hypothetical protein
MSGFSDKKKSLCFVEREFSSVATRSKAWVCGRLLAGIEGLNPSGGMNVRLLRFCVVRFRSCDGPIPCQESYRVCVSSFVIEYGEL